MNLLDKNKIDNGSDMLMKKRFVLRWNVSNEEGSFECYNATLQNFYYYFFVRSCAAISFVYKLKSDRFIHLGKNYFN